MGEVYEESRIDKFMAETSDIIIQCALLSFEKLHLLIILHRGHLIGKIQSSIASNELAWRLKLTRNTISLILFFIFIRCSFLCLGLAHLSDLRVQELLRVSDLRRLRILCLCCTDSLREGCGAGRLPTDLVKQVFKSVSLLIIHVWLVCCWSKF